MDKFTLICLAAFFVFFILGVLLNYPRKNGTGTKDNSVDTNSRKEEPEL
jgi:preprotein translocase subunit SecG